MKCTECRTGIISRTRKLDGLGRIIESCDACSYRRVISKDNAEPSAGLALRSVSVPATLPPREAVFKLSDTPLVVGQPCPCCHRKVTHLPREAQARHCMKCGELFTPKRGEKLKGLDVARCPKHRSTTKKK